MKLIEFGACKAKGIVDGGMQATGKSQEFMDGCKSTVIMLKWLLSLFSSLICSFPFQRNLGAESGLTTNYDRRSNRSLSEERIALTTFERN